MNNHAYHTPNLQQNVTQQQLLQQSSPPTQLSTSAASFGYLQQSPQVLQHHLSQHIQHPTHHHHQILTPGAALITNGTPAATTLYGLDKSGYYTTTTPITATTSTHHPNTILITNNFAQQSQPQKQQTHATPTAGLFKGSNIRIISAPNVYSISRSNGNDNNNIIDADEAQQIFDGASAATTTTQHMTDMLPTTYAPQHFATTTTTLQPYYLPTTAASDPIGISVGASAGNLLHQRTAGNSANNNNTAKMLPQVNAIAQMVTNRAASNSNGVPDAGANANTHANTTSSSNRNDSNANSNNSTVVLDRINICINNHYNETVPTICSPVTAAINGAPQQPSPIIPAIQHKPIIDSSSHYVDSSSCNSSLGISSSTETNNTSTAIIIIDEPDSTTTPHTPPTTPENTSPSKSSSAQSPSSTTSSSVILLSPERSETSKNTHLKQNFNGVAQTIKDASILFEKVISHVQDDSDDDIVCVEFSPRKTNTTPVALRPTTPPAVCSFSLQEGVFIRRQDERFYLGTIIDKAHSKFLVRFDDKTEEWFSAEEMRKLGSSQAMSPATAANNSVSAPRQPMCVACKQAHFADIVEICERCGRGYHRSCTMETAPGSAIWHCKRCAKPMKVLLAPLEIKKPAGICRQLPYHAEALSWDEKHRVNEEQIYCYCGGTGKFDQNMLQCCKCRNWFHTACMQHFKSKILRGDSFFVFCCTVCNNGVEFLRRLQIDWVDVLHLTLYNLRKHQHQKYHHLIKDIWPFVVEKRNIFPICHEWRELPETALMERIKQTLKEHTARFICGREFKRDHAYYGLRHNGPPITPRITIETHEPLTNKLLVEKLKLKLLACAPENNCKANAKAAITVPAVKDVYEFRIDDEDFETSDDEIPIKRIIDKVKQRKLSATLESKLDVADDNAYDASCQLAVSSTTLTTTTTAATTPTKKQNAIQLSSPQKHNAGNSSAKKPIKSDEVKSSRKRKAFRLSKSSYKELAGTSNSQRNCDLSSDENSSSSRGTSLDLIIPPLANFLGRNNPFLMVTPKKDSNARHAAGRVAGGGIKNSILNASTLDFSSKLLHLKGAGIFPNLSTSNLAKATGQPRTVRTIKRRLSAKDITIGPNQEVRRRRTRRLNSHVEVISTTTINPIPGNFFPIYAKDLNATQANFMQQASSTVLASITNASVELQTTDPATPRVSSQPVVHAPQVTKQKPAHGRLLRQRPQKSHSSPSNSRRSSTSSTQSSSTTTNNNNHSHIGATANIPNDSGEHANNMLDLKQTVNKYFGGAINRIEAGETYAIRAKRRLANGQLHYLIEWGEALANGTANASTVTAD